MVAVSCRVRLPCGSPAPRTRAPGDSAGPVAGGSITARPVAGNRLPAAVRGRFGDLAASAHSAPRRNGYHPAGRVGPVRVGARLFRGMKTYVATPENRTRDWYVVDAEGQTLGRLATQIADALRGKRKPRVHAALRRRRLRRRRQRREDRRHRRQAEEQALLPPQRLPGRHPLADPRGDARPQARGRHPPRRQGDASPQQDGPQAAAQAQGLRRARPSARSAAAEAPGGEQVSLERRRRARAGERRRRDFRARAPSSPRPNSPRPPRPRSPPPRPSRSRPRSPPPTGAGRGARRRRAGRGARRRGAGRGARRRGRAGAAEEPAEAGRGRQEGRRPRRRPRADRDRRGARADRRGARRPRGRGGGARAPARPPPPPRTTTTRRSPRAPSRSRPTPRSRRPASARAPSPGSSSAPATARFEINDRGIEEYFKSSQHQALARQPLVTAGYEGSVDVKVRVHGGGISGQAGAVRHGVARALTALEPELRGDLKRRGMLTRDDRRKERKKAGLKKARKRPQFSKR